MTIQVRVARVFAPSDANPLVGDDGQSWLTDAGERDKVASYLRAGAPILVTTALGVGHLAPTQAKCVGMSYRTDGEWVWSDALGYYAATYGLAPEDEFYRHIRDHGYECPAPDDEAQDHALARLYTTWQ